MNSDAEDRLVERWKQLVPGDALFKDLREWAYYLDEDDPRRLSPRKARLLAAALCRHHWADIDDVRSKSAVKVAEQYADGKVTEVVLQRHTDLADAADDDYLDDDLVSFDGPRVHWACSWASEPSVREEVMVRNVMDFLPATDFDKAAWADLVRDVIGHPVNPQPKPAAACFTRDVLSLAKSAYNNRVKGGRGLLDPFRLAILADALEEAGAEGPILEHLRLGCLHVRGCWALDLVLGKE
jgi:hypothetical protein